MTEKKFWGKIRAIWPGHAIRIEASEGGVDPGTPDSHLSAYGRGVFVELKCWPEPLQPMQLPWHLDALDRGAGAYVWCWVGDDSVWSGTAEAYQGLLGRKCRPAGVSLRLTVEGLLKVLQQAGRMV